MEEHAERYGYSVQLSQSQDIQGFAGSGKDLGLYPERNGEPLRVLRQGWAGDEICILGSTPFLLGKQMIENNGGGGGTREEATDYH